jgi:hypothetical protein
VPLADCWWVNGARVRVLADVSLRVSPAVPHGRSVQLDLAHIDRPVAFLRPVEPMCCRSRARNTTPPRPVMAKAVSRREGCQFEFDAGLDQARPSALDCLRQVGTQLGIRSTVQLQSGAPGRQSTAPNPWRPSKV